MEYSRHTTPPPSAADEPTPASFTSRLTSAPQGSPAGGGGASSPFDLRNAATGHHWTDADSPFPAPSDDPDSSFDSQSPPFTWSCASLRARCSHLVAPIRRYLKTLWIGQQLAIQYLIADTKRHKKGVGIGVFTVFLVVMLIVSVPGAGGSGSGRLEEEEGG